jgi:very-short-patch-repair endonuclease
MAKEERHLWYDYLNRYSLRFRHQEIIGNYIADFYCDKAKLVIELDGSQHYENAAVEYDKSRQAYLHSLGIEVLRFQNNDVSKNFEGVCFTIDKTVRERVKTLQSSSMTAPLRGEPRPFSHLR